MTNTKAKNFGHFEKLLAKRAEEVDHAQFREEFLALHPTDQAAIFIRFDAGERQSVYDILPPEEFSYIFEALDEYQQNVIFDELPGDYGTLMLNEMFTDNVATFLNEMDDDGAEKILLEMDPDEAAAAREVMGYAPETAGAVMTKEVVSISADDSVAEVLEQLRRVAPDAETIYYLYVIDAENRLAGVISLRDLITAQPEELIKDIMSKNLVSVREDVDQEDVARMIGDYDFLAVPVVSKDGQLLGIVTVDDVIDILEEEATEDLGELSAVKGATDINISPFRAAGKRAPWIVLLMFFGLITAGVIGQFEETLEEIVLLAIFIPLIMDSAGNTGTQSLGVAVRGLALGTIQKKTIGKMLRRELGTGVILGMICMAVLGITITLLYDQWLLALVVGFSIFCTLSIATVIGATVPLIINKIKLDPAIASGPFITTINDILGLLIYFSIATSLLDFF
ncbi:magnesium transporter [Salinicoccus halitifaciens]|uniref:Magnesium transporter MgtE n=1 Tax=Salinicoccus halitifaciens TaxID=1073415 RepID=A0ABV2E879_9STAP|nr:magnesium transporter [Salinicoccus halitifaciens]MCD2137746.1 magnesium transporter [Salinicoccus halitifaciens]